MAYQVLLLNCGNVDHDDDPTRPLYGPDEGIWHDVADVAEASKACRAYIERNDLGGGNWNGGFVRDEAGELVAWIAYNGRIVEAGNPNFPAHMAPEGLTVADGSRGPR